MHRRVRHLNPGQCGAQVALDSRFISGVADGAALSSWPGRPNTSISASQGMAAQQPTFRASSINGRPAVEFDGSADNMGLGAGGQSLTNNVASASITAVAINDGTGADATQYVAFLSAGASSNPRATLIARFSSAAEVRAQGRRLDADASRNTASAGASTAACVMTARHEFGTNAMTAGLNGVFTAAQTYASGAGNTSATNSNVANIGALNSAGSRLGGRIAAVVVAVPMFSEPVAKRIRQHLGFSFRIATT